MNEILKMWFFVRFFYKRQSQLASRDKSTEPLVQEVIKENGEWMGSVADAHIYTSKYMVALYILKEQFLFHFFLDYWFVCNSKNQYVDPKKFPRHGESLKYVNAILINCLSERYRFFQYGKGKDEKRIYITERGEQFSTFPIGLIREWLIYLSPVTSFLLGGGFIVLLWIVNHIWHILY